MSGLPRFTPKNIVVCGLGGSAIGGDLLSHWLSTHSEIPCAVSRSYSTPPFVGRDSLVLIASYSGDTEETIGMFEDARRKRAKMVVISSGGQLAQMSETYDVPFARLPAGMVPRASLGYMFGAMLGIVERAGVTRADKQFEEAVKVLGSVVSSCRQSVKTTDNPAKRLAHELFGFVPIVVGYGLSTPAAKRWANQLNENGKCMAYSTELPELDHNEIVGWARDPRSKGFAAVFLEHEDPNRSMNKRVDATKNMISEYARVFSVPSIGLSPLAKMFSLVTTGDFVSAYLGILREEDPSSTEPIEELKSVLAKK
ncbi:MAG: bifunctional phosphoglucose/phosphomannose isomerase [Thermoplasmata archaeon]